jgi:CTD kinase subunit beta
VIATGQALYHRFHLYFPMSEFNYIVRSFMLHCLFPSDGFLQEVSLSTLYVAAKLHDCLKKPRDLILASYAIRQPDMLKGRLALSVDPALFDPKQLESERKRMLSVERLVLETLCFNLMVGAEGGGSPGLDAFGLIIKLGRKAGCELTAKVPERTC